jgi:uncharacterized protein YdeI (YjbR/CyaY-like superfamily)
VERQSKTAQTEPELKKGQPIVEFEHADAWEEWLEQHHASSPGAWLKIAKKGATRSTVAHAAALEVALCYGWIDAQRDRYDDTFFLQRFTPRTAKSKWSQINRNKAEQLIAEKRMKPPGLSEVRKAQHDGRWEAAYPAQSQATVPEDFQSALDENPKAKEFFATVTGVNRYAFLYRLHNVKTPAGRARRIRNYIALLNEGKTLR